MIVKSIKCAFTLIELLVVIAIIAVLAALLIPTIGKVMESTRSAQCLANLRSLGMIALTYSADNNGELLPVFDTNTRRSWIQMLVLGGYLPREEWDDQDKSIMRCPSRDNNPTLFGPKLHYGLTMSPWGDDNIGNDNDGYKNLIGAGQKPWRMIMVQRPSSTLLFGEVQSNPHPGYWLNEDGTRGANIYPHSGGSNLVFMDGHAEFYPGELTLDEDADSTFPFY